MLSEVQKLRDLIDQSESIILINLDSQRNVMMRLSLQLEMGVFSATLAGLIGMAFGMNLDSSLEEVCVCVRVFICVCKCVCVCVFVHWWLSGIHSELPIERLVVQSQPVVIWCSVFSKQQCLQ